MADRIRIERQWFDEDGNPFHYFSGDQREFESEEEWAGHNEPTKDCFVAYYRIVGKDVRTN